MLETGSPEETEGWAESLGRRLQAPLLITLEGPLGAGKTTFVRGLCRGLDIAESEVSSPTFVLLQIYAGRLPVYHLDAYRLDGPRDLEGIGALDYFEGDGICVLEWPDRAEGLLPEDRLELHLDVLGPERRSLAWRALGPRAQEAVEGL